MSDREIIVKALWENTVSFGELIIANIYYLLCPQLVSSVFVFGLTWAGFSVFLMVMRDIRGCK